MHASCLQSTLGNEINTKLIAPKNSTGLQLQHFDQINIIHPPTLLHLHQTTLH